MKVEVEVKEMKEAMRQSAALPSEAVEVIRAASVSTLGQVFHILK